MSTAGHIDDKLLDYAYGELPASQMREAHSHLENCPKCSQALSEIRQVRKAMAQLPMVPAPAEGLDSLVSYARQHSKIHAKSAPWWTQWRRVVLPVAGVAACTVLLVISNRVAKETASSLNSLKEPPGLAPAPPRMTKVAPRPMTRPPPTSAHNEAMGGVTGGVRVPAEVPNESPSTAQKTEPKADTAFRDDHSFAATPTKEQAETIPATEGDFDREFGTTDVARRAETKRTKSVATLQPAMPPEPHTHGKGGGVEAMGRMSALSAQPTLSAPSPSQAPGVGSLGLSVRGSGSSAPSAPSATEAPTASIYRSPNQGETLGDESIRREVASVRQSLGENTTGPQRAQLLNRLCELLFKLGENENATAACDAVITEFPNTDAARTAKNLKTTASPPRPSHE